MKQPKILLIEDEEDIASLVKMHIQMAGYDLQVETDGLEGYLAVEKEKPDLVLLDIMLPSLNGLDICRKIKKHSELKEIPVIMLSARSEEIDVVLGLELGADDYVPKPFSPKILMSRIKAVLRRGEEKTGEIEGKKEQKKILFGPFVLDVEGYSLSKDGISIPLTLSEFNILKRLLANKGRVFSRSQLLDDLQNEEAVVIDRNIDVHIASLRKKLGPNFKNIETVRGVGYRFKV